MKRCPKCKQTFADGFSFCTNDGALLAKVEPPPPQAKPPGKEREPVRQSEPKRQPRKPKDAAKRQPDDMRKAKLLIGSMVVVGIALIVLVALAFSGAFSGGASTDSDASRGLDEFDDEEQEEGVHPATEARVVAFFSRWKSTGDASDQEWADMAWAAGQAATLSRGDRHAQARNEYAQGQVALRRGDLGRADSWYATASDSWPEWALAINGRGKIAARQRDYAEAARYYRAAIEADPEWLFPRTNLIGALINLRRYNEVETEARRALAVDRNSAYAHYALAVVHGRANRYTDAISEAETALRLDPRGSTGFNAANLRELISSWQASGHGGSTTTQRGYPKRMIVNTPDDGFLSLRSAPSAATGDRISRIPHRTTISLSSCQSRVLRIEGEFGHWCRTTFAGRSGWVFDGFLSLR